MHDEEQLRRDEQIAREMSRNINGGMFGAGLPPGGDQHLVQQNMARGLREIRHQSKKILIAIFVFAVIEAIVAMAILGKYWDDASCGQPFQLWLLLHELRWCVNLPIEYTRYKWSRSGRDTSYLDDIRSFTSMVSFVWVIFGVRWLSMTMCRTGLWWTIAVFCSCSILMTLLPLMFCLAVCVCLPCLLVWMRLFSEPTGVTEAVLAEIPERIVTQTEADDGKQCSICLEDYQLDEHVKTLPCNHEFHTDCAGHWLKIKGSCPLCRADIRTGLPKDDDAKEEDSLIPDTVVANYGSTPAEVESVV